ncbi:teichoic acid D-Ala incorporation-associated protein DltX [Streptococcus plurextorum]|nr:teichoic acid D-Ala incorporation-associated protein DltX [Streptococcus plurextorum]
MKQFLVRTLLYFVIILVLIYLYSYIGRSQGSFIYNEF